MIAAGSGRQISSLFDNRLPSKTWWTRLHELKETEHFVTARTHIGSTLRLCVSARQEDVKHPFGLLWAAFSTARHISRRRTGKTRIVKLDHDRIVHQFHNKDIGRFALAAALQSGRVFHHILTVHAGHYCEYLSRRSRAKISQ